MPGEPSLSGSKPAAPEPASSSPEAVRSVSRSLADSAIVAGMPGAALLQKISGPSPEQAPWDIQPAEARLVARTTRWAFGLFAYAGSKRGPEITGQRNETRQGKAGIACRKADIVSPLSVAVLRRRSRHKKPGPAESSTCSQLGTLSRRGGENRTASRIKDNLL